MIVFAYLKIKKIWTETWTVFELKYIKKHSLLSQVLIWKQFSEL